MTLNDFIKKYDGEGIDFDGSFGHQCMDLYRQYVSEVLDFPQSSPVPSAKDVWKTYLNDFYERIANTPSGVPRSGDIVIWGDKLGEHGHIAVFVEGNAVKFKSFDQNFPVGTKSHIQEHTYKGVLGWLAPKSRGADPDMKLQWLVQMYKQRNVDVTKPEGDVRGAVQQIFDNSDKHDEKTKRIEDLEKNLAGVSGEAAENESRFLSSQKGRKEDKKEIEDLNIKIVRRDQQIRKLQDEVVKLTELDIATIDPMPNTEQNRLSALIKRILRR